MDMLSRRKVLGNLGGEMSVLGEAIAPKSTDCRDILRGFAGEFVLMIGIACPKYITRD